MYPHERSLVKQLSNKKFALIGVNSDKDREKLKEVLDEKNISWRSFWNGGSTSGPISTRWNVRGWPTIYVLDVNGVIRFKNVRGEKMDRAIETLLAEAGEPVSIAHDEEEEGEGEESGAGKDKPDADADKGGDKPAQPKSDANGTGEPQ
jgi:hypothetical protein